MTFVLAVVSWLWHQKHKQQKQKIDQHDWRTKFGIRAVLHPYQWGERRDWWEKHYYQMELGIQITHIFSLIMVNFSTSASQNLMFEKFDKYEYSQTSLPRDWLSIYKAGHLNLEWYKVVHGFCWSHRFRNHSPAFHWCFRTTKHDTPMVRTW